MGKSEDYIEKVTGLIKGTEINVFLKVFLNKDADYFHCNRLIGFSCERLRNEKIV
jgi:hypothetical protein